MTLPLFYNPSITASSPDQLIVLDAAASGHAIRSQRLSQGDQVLVSNGAGVLGEGVIIEASPAQTGIQISRVTVEKPPTVRLNLVQALAKGDRDLLAAEMATELGVDSVTPWQAQRSIVRVRPERAVKTFSKWQGKLQAAAQQSRRATIPRLNELIVGSDIVDLHNPSAGHHVVILHEDGDQRLDHIVDELSAADTIHVVVGPEGGVSPEELRAVQSVGGNAVRIGTNVMRASTAGPVAIALLNHLLGRWS